jgi:hypothetical protein
MGTESQGFTDDIAFWRRGTFAWMLIIALESLHGAVREIFIAPVLGDLRARQLGVLVGCVIVLLVAWLTARWLAANTRRLQLTAGLLWVALTLVFEIALGRAIGASWDRILEDYNPARGGFMLLGIAFMACAPMLAARLRNLSRNDR